MNRILAIVWAAVVVMLIIACFHPRTTVTDKVLLTFAAIVGGICAWTQWKAK